MLFWAGQSRKIFSTATTFGWKQNPSTGHIQYELLFSQGFFSTSSGCRLLLTSPSSLNKCCSCWKNENRWQQSINSIFSVITLTLDSLTFEAFAKITLNLRFYCIGIISPSCGAQSAEGPSVFCSHLRARWHHICKPNEKGFALPWPPIASHWKPSVISLLCGCCTFSTLFACSSYNDTSPLVLSCSPCSHKA